MKNKDNYNEEYLHLFVALRRRKDNAEGKEICFREIIRDYDVDMQRLMVRLSEIEGNWRIHKTINKRCVKKATKELIKSLIDDDKNFFSLVSDFKTHLMKPYSKAERNILIDVDVDDVDYVNLILKKIGGSGKRIFKTPNGYHIVSDKFDTRVLENMPDITLQRDGYHFVKYVTIGNR